MIEKKIDSSSILLIIFIAITFTTSIIISTIQTFTDNWFEGKIVIVVLTCLQILRIMSYILPALAIKNKTCKIIGVTLSVIMVVYLLISPLKLLYN